MYFTIFYVTNNMYIFLQIHQNFLKAEKLNDIVYASPCTNILNSTWQCMHFIMHLLTAKLKEKQNKTKKILQT